jgi:hypothetical protein
MAHKVHRHIDGRHRLIQVLVHTEADTRVAHLVNVEAQVPSQLQAARMWTWRVPIYSSPTIMIRGWEACENLVDET